MLAYSWLYATPFLTRALPCAQQFMADQRDLLPLVHTLLYLEEALDVRT